MRSVRVALGFLALLLAALPARAADPVGILGELVQISGDEIVVRDLTDATRTIRVQPSTKFDRDMRAIPAGTPVFVGAEMLEGALTARVVAPLTGMPGAPVTPTDISAIAKQALAAAPQIVSAPSQADLTCRAISGFIPTTDTLDFFGCIGAPTLFYGVSTDTSIFKSSPGANPLVEMFLTRFEITVSLGGGTYELPFKFSAIDVDSENIENWAKACIANLGTIDGCPNRPFEPSPGAERTIRVSVTPVNPSPAASYTFGWGIEAKLLLRINTLVGCGPVGFDPCSFNTQFPVSPTKGLSSFATARGAAPIAPGATLRTDSTCIALGFSTVLPPVVGTLISPVDIDICTPEIIGAPSTGFETKLVSGVSGGVVSLNGSSSSSPGVDPKLQFVGNSFLVRYRPPNASSQPVIRFKDFFYMPSLQRRMFFRTRLLFGGLIQVPTPEFVVDNLTLPAVPSAYQFFLQNAHKVPGFLTFLEDPQPTYIDVPVKLTSFGSAAITDYAPRAVDHAGGTKVRVTGRGFLPARNSSNAIIPGTGVTRIRMHGVDISFNVISDTEMEFTTPPLPSDIEVDADGHFVRGLLGGFTMRAWGLDISKTLPTAGSPTIEQVLSLQGFPLIPSSGGTPIVLDFLYDAKTLTEVWVDGVSVPFTKCVYGDPAVGICNGSMGGWWAIAPPHAAGAVHVQARVACDAAQLTQVSSLFCGLTTIRTSDMITYQGLPVITSLSRTGGLPAGGETVTVTGTGFFGPATVNFGDSHFYVCTSSSCNFSNTTLTVTAPPGAAGSIVPVTVSIPCPNWVDIGGAPHGDSCGESLPVYYKYLGPPGIASVSPSAGPFSGGTEITLTGAGFITATSALVGITPVPLTVVSDTQVRVTMPAGYPDHVTTLPGNVQVSVIVACGIAYPAATACGQSNTATFTYNPPTSRLSTTLTLVNATGIARGSATLRATLRSSGSPVSGRTVTFMVKGTSAGTAETDADGVATLLAGDLAALASGIYPGGLTATFAGDLAYAPSSVVGDITATTGELVVWGASLGSFYSPSIVPVDVRNVRSVAHGVSTVVAVHNDGTLSGWGSPVFGGIAVPAGLTGITAVSTSKGGGLYSVTAALKADGSVVVWNDFGLAQPPPGLPPLQAVAVSQEEIAVLGLTTSGEVVGWGRNSWGALTIPAAAQSGVVAIADPSFHAAALKSDGTVVTWGCASICAGGGDFVGIEPPSGLATVTAVSVGRGGTTMVLKQDGSIVRWGRTNSAVPALPAGQRVRFIDHNGGGTAIAVTEDGVVRQLATFGAGVIGSLGPDALAFSAGYGAYAAIVPPRVATTTSVSGVTGLRGSTQTLSAMVMAGDAPVSGVTVSFALNGLGAGTAVTNATGTATLSATIPLSIAGGTYAGGVAASVPTDATWHGSSGSNTLIAERIAQTITFGALANRTFGDPAFVVSATASSGLAVTFAASGACTVAVTTVTITGIGTCTITASQAGDDDYAAAPDVPRAFSIAQQSQTISFGVLGNKAYGDAPFTVAATSSAGLPVAFSFAGQCTLTGNPNEVRILGAGLCVVIASQSGNANVAAAVNVERAFEITAAPLTITVADKSKLYRDNNPAFTGTVTGLVYGESLIVTYSSVADTLSPVGTYPIVPSITDPGAFNYSITVVNGTLTVNARPITAVADNASRVYGVPSPTFGGTLGGESTSSIDGFGVYYFFIGETNEIAKVRFDSAAGPASPIGAYPIVPTLIRVDGFPWDGSIPTTSNYAFTATPGVLTIGRAPLTVTADNAKRGEGEPNPTFTGSFAGLVNGDPISATYSTTADENSVPGAYPIVPTVDDGETDALDNYTVSLVNGTLTVVRRPDLPAIPTPNRLVSWGATAYGQTNVPAGAVDLVAIDAAVTHSVAAAYDGVVFAWGDMDAGIPFTGFPSPSTIPAELTVPTVSGAPRPVAVSAGLYHNLVLMSDGTIRGWGRDGATARPYSPVALNDVFAISGGLISIAVMADGSVVTWPQRYNTSGPTFPMVLVPAPAPGAPMPMAAYSSREPGLGGSFAILRDDGSVAVYNYSLVFESDVEGVYQGYSFSKPTIDSVTIDAGPYASMAAYRGIAVSDGEIVSTSYSPLAPPGLFDVYAFALGSHFAGGHGSAIVGPARQEISFAPLADRDFSDPYTDTNYAGNVVNGIQLRALASSRLPVTFSVTGPCTLGEDYFIVEIDGVVRMLPGYFVTPTAPGTCSVTASQAGDATYPAAPDVVRSFEISVGGQHISFGTVGPKRYGDAPFPILATASSGLPVTLSLTSGPATLAADGTLTLTGAGTVVIHASQAGNDDYNAVTAKLSLEVAQAQLFVRAANRHATVGDASVSLGGTVTGLLNGDAVTITYSTDPDATSAIGTYVIVPAVSGAAAGSYAVMTTNGTLTVGATNRVVAWGDNSFGQTDVPAGAVNVMSLVAAGNHSVAVGRNGKVYAWGQPLTGAPMPADVASPSPNDPRAVAVAASAFNALALMDDSTLRGWGRGARWSSPFTPPSLAGVVAIASGGIPLAVTSDGAIWTWADAPGASAYWLVPPSSGEVKPVSVSTAMSGDFGAFAVLMSDGSASLFTYHLDYPNYLHVTLDTQQDFAGPYTAVALINDPANGPTMLARGADGVITRLPAETSIEGTFSVLGGGDLGGAAIADGEVEALDPAQSASVGVIDGLTGVTSAMFAAAHGVAITELMSADSQTISFNALPDTTFGYGPFSLTATATSGLPVAFAAAGKCTVAGSMLTLTGAGTCTVTASQPGGPGFPAAPDVARSFSIAKAAQSIAFNGYIWDLTYGDAPVDLAPSSSSGEAVTVTVVSGGGIVAPNNILTFGAAGTIALHATVAGNDDFEPAETDFEIGIQQRSIYVAAQPQTKSAGQVDPLLTYQVVMGSVLPGDTFTGGLSREPGETDGSYLINQGTLSLGPNYLLTVFGDYLEITASCADVNHNSVCDTEEPPLCTPYTLTLTASGTAMSAPLSIMGVTDPLGRALTYDVIGVKQDERTRMVASDPYPDATLFPLTVRRQVTAGPYTGDGRFYHVSYVATNSDGASCSGLFKVAIKGTSAPVDQGPIHDSLR